MSCCFETETSIGSGDDDRLAGEWVRRIWKLDEELSVEEIDKKCHDYGDGGVKTLLKGTVLFGRRFCYISALEDEM